MSNRNLSEDQRLMLQNYITQYNQTNNQINYLYGVLADIRVNINAINQQIVHPRPNTIPISRPVTIPYPIPTSIPPLRPITPIVSRQRQRRPSIFDEYDLNIFNIPVNTSSTRLLSSQEIEEATLTTTFSNIALPINTECPIRLEEFNDSDVVTQIRHCGHIFNSNELNNWFITNNRCPVCRHNIRSSLNQNNNNSQHDYSTTLINSLISGLFNEFTIVPDASNNIISDISNNNTTASNNNSNNSNN
jgi:hypothetical protein